MGSSKRVAIAGDEEYQSARQEHSDAGSSDFEERSSLKEEAQSQSEGSFGNGVSLDADEGATDSGYSLILSDEIAGILFICLYTSSRHVSVLIL